MKTLTLKETANQYLLELDEEGVIQGPMLLETEGRPVAVLIPAAEYTAFQEWLAMRRAMTAPAEFEREVAAFERLKPALLEQYPGRAVAIHGSQVVAVGDDKMAVLDDVMKQFGPAPCYIEWVERETPRRARISSAWVAR